MSSGVASGADSDPDGAGPVLRRDARGHALSRLDGDGEVGALLAVGVADHQWQAQLLAAGPRQCQADQARGQTVP